MRVSWGNNRKTTISTEFFFFSFFFVVNFVIHWNETAMGLHVFPIPIPPPTSLHGVLSCKLSCDEPLTRTLPYKATRAHRLFEVSHPRLLSGKSWF